MSKDLIEISFIEQALQMDPFFSSEETIHDEVRAILQDWKKNRQQTEQVTQHEQVVFFNGTPEGITLAQDKEKNKTEQTIKYDEDDEDVEDDEGDDNGDDEDDGEGDDEDDVEDDDEEDDVDNDDEFKLDYYWRDDPLPSQNDVLKQKKDSMKDDVRKPTKKTSKPVSFKKCIKKENSQSSRSRFYIDMDTTQVAKECGKIQKKQPCELTDNVIKDAKTKDGAKDAKHLFAEKYKQNQERRRNVKVVKKASKIKDGLSNENNECETSDTDMEVIYTNWDLEKGVEESVISELENVHSKSNTNSVKKPMHKLAQKAAHPVSSIKSVGEGKLLNCRSHFYVDIKSTQIAKVCGKLQKDQTKKSADIEVEVTPKETTNAFKLTKERKRNRDRFRTIEILKENNNVQKSETIRSKKGRYEYMYIDLSKDFEETSTIETETKDSGVNKNTEKHERNGDEFQTKKIERDEKDISGETNYMNDSGTGAEEKSIHIQNNSNELQELEQKLRKPGSSHSSNNSIKEICDIFADECSSPIGNTTERNRLLAGTNAKNANASKSNKTRKRSADRFKTKQVKKHLENVEAMSKTEKHKTKTLAKSKAKSVHTTCEMDRDAEEVHSPLSSYLQATPEIVKKDIPNQNYLDLNLMINSENDQPSAQTTQSILFRYYQLKTKTALKNRQKAEKTETLDAIETTDASVLNGGKPGDDCGNCVVDVLNKPSNDKDGEITSESKSRSTLVPQRLATISRNDKSVPKFNNESKHDESNNLDPLDPLETNRHCPTNRKSNEQNLINRKLSEASYNPANNAQRATTHSVGLGSKKSRLVPPSALCLSGLQKFSMISGTMSASNSDLETASTKSSTTPRYLNNELNSAEQNLSTPTKYVCSKSISSLNSMSSTDHFSIKSKSSQNLERNYDLGKTYRHPAPKLLQPDSASGYERHTEASAIKKDDITSLKDCQAPTRLRAPTPRGSLRAGALRPPSIYLSDKYRDRLTPRNSARSQNGTIELQQQLNDPTAEVHCAAELPNNKTITKPAKPSPLKPPGTYRRRSQLIMPPERP